MISFQVTKQEAKIISRAAARAVRHAFQHGIDYEFPDAEMDLTACHANGCPLDFEKLLAFDDANFGHDVFGIRKFMDRSTGELTDCFVPRSAKQ